MFADRAKIFIKSGKGGDGHVSFRRELYVPAGGPDGGDGGKGGDVIFVVDKSINTLNDFRHIRKYWAENGQDGMKKRCHGKDGEDIIIKVPEGTIIKDAESGKVIVDMSHGHEREVLLNGGNGGKGNQHYATPTMQAPKYAQPGQPAKEMYVTLELKVIADVGLVGFPNVGKSTFLSRVTNAKPKIANYHFTTLNPNLGVVDLPGADGFVIADIPGLIEGASQGIGLGHEFLKHIERTRLLVHVLDMAGSEGRDPIADFNAIMKELENYSDRLSEKDMFVVANKMDIAGAKDNLELFKIQYPEIDVIETSAATTEGIDQLKFYIFERLKNIEKEYNSFDEINRLDLEEFFKVDRTINIYVDQGVYVVEGHPVEVLVKRTNFEDFDSIRNFEQVLDKMGIMNRLEELGVEDGDTIEVAGVEIDYLG